MGLWERENMKRGYREWSHVFCIAHRRYIECLTSLKNWGHLIYGLVGVWVCSQAYYFAMSLSGCSSCFGCSVENGRLTWRTEAVKTTTKTRPNPPSLPPLNIFSWWVVKPLDKAGKLYLSVGHIKISSWQFVEKTLIHQWVVISQYRELTRPFTENSVTLTVISKNAYFSISCN